MSRRRGRGKRINPVIYFFVIAIIVGLDQILKNLVEHKFLLHESMPVIKNVLHITYVRNTGILFGLLKGYNSIFIIVEIIVIFWLIIYIFYLRQNLYRSFCLTLIFSGAIGNLLDRLLHGYIIDFIDFRIWPVFNLSDSVITIGLILLSVGLFKDILKNKS